MHYTRLRRPEVCKCWRGDQTHNPAGCKNTHQEVSGQKLSHSNLEFYLRSLSNFLSTHVLYINGIIWYIFLIIVYIYVVGFAVCDTVACFKGEFIYKEAAAYDYNRVHWVHIGVPK